MIKALKFQPWISDAYRNNEGKYGRLLILGESHYTSDKPTYDEAQKDFDSEELLSFDLPEEKKYFGKFTEDIVTEFINEESDINFFRNLGLLFNPYDRIEVWKNVAFANGIQTLLLESNGQPTKNEISTVKEAFWSLLDNLKPDRVLVCSQRMWNYWLPDDNERGYLLTHHYANGKHSTIWKYNREGGHTFAMAINHPSKYFSYSNWEPLVKSFISKNFDAIQ